MRFLEPNKIKLSQIPAKNTSGILQVVTQEGVLLIFLGTTFSFLLQAGSVDVWRLIDGKRPVKDIISKISEKYTGSEQKIARYALEAVSKLIEIKAIHHLYCWLFEIHNSIGSHLLHFLG